MIYKNLRQLQFMLQ